MADENFTVIEASKGGMPAILAVNTALDRTAAGRMPWLVTLSFPLNEVNTAGLCSSEESHRLDDLEDLILEPIPDPLYLYAGRVTWNGSRDVFLYVADGEAFVRTLTGVLSLDAVVDAVGENEIGIEAEYEPTWETHAGLLPPAGS